MHSEPEFSADCTGLELSLVDTADEQKIGPARLGGVATHRAAGCDSVLLPLCGSKKSFEVLGF